jgi:tetrahydromethanopterin S-methyltransferase subunit B
MAHRAQDDAASAGYPDSLPIFFCADGWLALNDIPVDTAMSYLDGAASVLGKHRIGAYGFRDFIQAAKAGGHAEWLWLCGSAPDDGELAQGWPHFYQWNGAHIYPGGLEADLNWAYPGVLEALRANGPAPTQYQVRPGEPGPSGPGGPDRPPHPRDSVASNSAANGSAANGSAADGSAASSTAVSGTPAAAAAAAAKQHADDAANSAADSKKQADAAQAALAGVQAAASAEPGWIYGMVIGILGAALLALVVAMVIASLTGSRAIPADVASATTLILGGLIGILAPTPSKKGAGSRTQPPAS